MIFDDYTLPADQPTAIADSIQTLPKPLPDDLKSAIRAASPHVRLIHQRMQDKIREQYSAEDEMKFSRIGVGQALGHYTMTTAEATALLAFGHHLEACRQWSHTERAKLGV